MAKKRARVKGKGADIFFSSDSQTAQQDTGTPASLRTSNSMPSKGQCFSYVKSIASRRTNQKSCGLLRKQCAHPSTDVASAPKQFNVIGFPRPRRLAHTQFPSIP